jgi:hypothetical protein
VGAGAAEVDVASAVAVFDVGKAEADGASLAVVPSEVQPAARIAAAKLIKPIFPRVIPTRFHGTLEAGAGYRRAVDLGNQRRRREPVGTSTFLTESGMGGG